MKKIYILLTLFFILAFFLVIFAFLFLEKGKHTVLSYKVESNGETAGYVKVDLYNTEDKIVYKSGSFFPKELYNRIMYNKLIFDKKTTELDRFTRESKNFGTVTESLYIKNNADKTFNYLAKSQSKFSCATGVEHAKNISVFNENSLVTYMPIVDKYDFALGGAQSFAVIYQPFIFLPPAKCNLILTTMGDCYLPVEGKRIKTELLLARSRIISPCYIWVSKKTKKIVQLESKSNSLFIKKVAFPQKIEAKPFILQDPSYRPREVIIPSGDIALAGTMSIPEKGGKLPGVLLVGGKNACNRDEAGLFTYIADDLAKKGYVVLRYDKRGIGDSQGDSSATDLESDMLDISNAFKFLSNHEKVKADKVFILGHGESCSYLPALNFSDLGAKGLLMLGILKPEPILDFESPAVSDRIKTFAKVDQGYEKTLSALKEETLKLAKDPKREYAHVDGNRIFLKMTAQILQFDPLGNFAGLKTPLLIIHGKKDRQASPFYLDEIEKVFAQNTSFNVSTVYFRNENHFLGELEEPKNAVKHYRINNEILDTISGWVEKNSADILPET